MISRSWWSKSSIVRLPISFMRGAAAPDVRFCLVSDINNATSHDKELRRRFEAK